MILISLSWYSKAERVTHLPNRTPVGFSETMSDSGVSYVLPIAMLLEELDSADSKLLFQKANRWNVLALTPRLECSLRCPFGRTNYKKKDWIVFSLITMVSFVLVSTYFSSLLFPKAVGEVDIGRLFI